MLQKPILNAIATYFDNAYLDTEEGESNTCSVSSVSNMDDSDVGIALVAFRFDVQDDKQLKDIVELISLMGPALAKIVAADPQDPEVKH